MAIRTVRLDAEAEAALEEIREATGLPISDVLKEGVRAVRQRVRQQPTRPPYHVFAGLDLGPGGYAIAPSSRAKRAVREVIAAKHRR